MKDDKLYLIHIAECIAKIESYIERIDLSTFMTQAIVQDAVLRNLQVLAESTQRLPDDFKLQHHEVEWYKIAGLRNILVHDYLGIDLETVWAVVEKKLPELKEAVRTALGS
ncbi:MAG: HepT-like ribonuclease domain-containing protein [Desulfobulbia bacterium]